MPINLPANRNEVVNRIKTDIQTKLEGSNPWLRNSWFLALAVAIGGRIYDFYYQLKNNLIPNLFPWSAESTYLQRWGGWVGINKNPATQAAGPVVFTGVVGTVIPNATEVQLPDGNNGTTQAEGTIATVTASITALSRSGSTASATTSAAHSFATGQSVTIAGAVETEYNGFFPIVVVDSTHFTFTVPGTPATPATGTITAASDMASITVKTEDYGQDANQDSGAQITLSTPITGIDSSAYVGLAGLAGGTDEESDDDYRVRVQERYQNPVTLFNDAAIIAAAKSVPGVTRVWVYDCTPETGQVTVYFVRDNDADIIPTAPEIAEVLAAIMAIAPANVAEEDVIVDAPTPVEVDFTFTAIDPDTTTMQAAIEASLAQAFKENAQVGIDFAAYVYNTAIFGTVDLSTGASLDSFTISDPAGDVTIADGELAVLGTVTFS